METICPNYTIDSSIDTIQGITITLSGRIPQLSDPNYCCVAQLSPSECASSQGLHAAECIPICYGWDCDTTGFIIGWVIGVFLIAVILILALSLKKTLTY